jgi:hypothetical protein
MYKICKQANAIPIEDRVKKISESLYNWYLANIEKDYEEDKKAYGIEDDKYQFKTEGVSQEDFIEFVKQDMEEYHKSKQKGN